MCKVFYMCIILKPKSILDPSARYCVASTAEIRISRQMNRCVSKCKTLEEAEQKIIELS